LEEDLRQFRQKIRVNSREIRGSFPSLEISAFATAAAECARRDDECDPGADSARANGRVDA